MHKLLAVLLVLSSPLAFAKREAPTLFNVDKKLCRPALENLMGVEGSREENIEKKFSGKNTETNEICNIKLKIYAPNGSVGQLYVDVEKGLFFPFNHFVNLTNDCNASDSVKGKFSFREDGGWRHRYTTSTKIEKLESGDLKITYMNEGSGVECIGKMIN